jgi:hypothetical protein
MIVHLSVNGRPPEIWLDEGDPAPALCRNPDCYHVWIPSEVELQSHTPVCPNCGGAVEIDSQEWRPTTPS